MKKPHIFTTLRALQAGILASALFAAPAFGARLAYEGFNYTQADGTKLNAITTPGGTGWTGNFGETTTDLTTDASLISPGLTYPGLAPTPGKAMRWQNGNRFYRPWGSGTYAAPAAPANGTYWYSLLFRPLGGRGTIAIMGKPDDPQNGFGIRMDNETNSAAGLNPQFKAHSDNFSGTPNLNFTNGYNKTYFIVGKIVINSAGAAGVGAHSNTIWVYDDPTALPTVEPTTGGSTVTSNNTQIAAFRTALTGRGFGDAGVGLSADEVRIGNAFTEVFPRVGNFSVSPSSAVQNQELTFNWSAIPASATSITLNPGSIDLLPLTTGGVGTTTLPAPAASTNYTLTFSDGVSTEVIDAPYTAIAPFLTISPSSGNLGDTLTLNWRIPAGATAITLSPNAESLDLNLLTNAATGIGTAQIAAPASTTPYTITWTGAGNGATGVSATFTLLPSFVSVTPDSAIADVSDLTVQWRIDPAFSSDPVNINVFIDIGPVGGPYVTTDVTANTDTTTGAGTFLITPTLTDVQYRVRFHLGGLEQTVTDTVVLYPKVFDLGLPVNNTRPVQTNLQPMFNGVTAYSDRSHAWSAVPSILQGAQFAKLGQDEKFTTNLQVPFTAVTNGTFFLLIDNRMGDGIGGTNPAAGTDNPPTLGSGVMNWVLTSGFVDSGLDVGLDENPVPNTTTIDQSYSIFFRQVGVGETFTFLEQNDGGARNMYGIAAVTPQIDPVTFFASPATINSNVANFTTLNWTVPVGATVTINQGVGSVTTNEFGIGSTNVFPTATTTYTLTYDPVGPSPAVNLPPVTVDVNSLSATPDTYVVGGSTTLNWQIPPGSTNVLINQGVGNVTADTNGAGIGSKSGVTAGVGTPSYTLTYIAPGATGTTTVGPVSVSVLNTPFGTWMAELFSGITAPNNAPGADPDGDGISNFGEFAFSGDPGSGSDNGLTRSAIDNVDGTNYLTMTFACRSGATFSGPGPVVSAAVEGVVYTVRASLDLSAFTVGLTEVTPAIVTGLPEITSFDYEYRTFRMTGAQSANPKAFIQAVAAPAP